jgi:hypothetical protein
MLPLHPLLTVSSEKQANRRFFPLRAEHSRLAFFWMAMTFTEKICGVVAGMPQSVTNCYNHEFL